LGLANVENGTRNELVFGHKALFLNDFFLYAWIPLEANQTQSGAIELARPNRP
jgi:hypothetical protein